MILVGSDRVGIFSKSTPFVGNVFCPLWRPVVYSGQHMITDRERRIETRGIAAKQRLVWANPLLNPQGLQTVFPQYALYPRTDSQSLASRISSERDTRAPSDKLVVLISGPSGSGKDTLRKNIEARLPGQTRKIVTATSRSPREDEVEGVDYYFLGGVDAFRRAISRNELLEFSVQGSEKDGTLRLYGTPKQSLIDALQKPEQILISHVEMSDGWPNVRKFAHSMKHAPSVIRMFILPEMSAEEYFNPWLRRVRPKDFAERANRAGWEFEQAPRVADVLVRNRISDGEQALDRAAEEAVDMFTAKLAST